MKLQKRHFTRGVNEIILGSSPAEHSSDLKEFLSSTHPQREIFYVLDGQSRYMLNGKVYDALPGTFFLIDSWETHAFGYRKQDHDLLHLWLQISDQEHQITGQIMEVVHGGEYRVVGNPVQLPPEYLTILERRWNALSRGNTLSPEEIMVFLKSPLEALLDEMFFHLFLSNGIEQGKNTVDNVVESLKRYIRMSNARDCSLDRLEKFSGYSRFYLSHRFRKHEGCTIGQYIDKVRLRYTEEALKRGLRQKEIAFELGFSSPSNFWIWLRKHKISIPPK